METTHQRSKPCRLKPEQLLALNREFASILRARLPLPEGTRHFARQVHRRDFQSLLRAVADDLSSGVPLSEALGRFKTAFPSSYLYALRAGEATGDLLGALDHLIRIESGLAAIRKRIRSAATYPLIVLSTAALVSLLFFFVIIPGWERILTEHLSYLGPPPSLGLVGHAATGVFALSAWLREAWPILLGTLLLAAGFFRVMMRSPVVRADWGRILVHLPLTGELLKNLDLARFCHSLGHLLGSGVPLDESLSLTANVTQNGMAQLACARMGQRVRKGVSLTTAMEDERFFPPTFRWIVREAEDRGDLAARLMQAGTEFQEWAFEGLENLTRGLEPLIILYLGALVLLLVVAFSKASVALGWHFWYL